MISEDVNPEDVNPEDVNSEDVISGHVISDVMSEDVISEHKGTVRVATSATLAILLFHLTKNLERPRQLYHLGLSLIHI